MPSDSDLEPRLLSLDLRPLEPLALPDFFIPFLGDPWPAAMPQGVNLLGTFPLNLVTLLSGSLGPFYC